MLHADGGAGSAPPPSQFHVLRCRHHFRPTAHRDMLCIHETYQVLIKNMVRVGLMWTADVLLRLLRSYKLYLTMKI